MGSKISNIVSLSKTFGSEENGAAILDCEGLLFIYGLTRLFLFMRQWLFS